MADPRIIACPLPDYDDVTKGGDPVYHVTIPAVWTGADVDRKDAALEKAREKKLGPTMMQFAACLSLCESWNLPGLPNGTIEPEALRALPWQLISWVNRVVWSDFQEAAYVEKKD